MVIRWFQFLTIIAMSSGDQYSNQSHHENAGRRRNARGDFGTVPTTIVVATTAVIILGSQCAIIRHRVDGKCHIGRGAEDIFGW